ncbi:MAG: 3-phosphoshikimate 1-carboxyvinyltransferase [Bacteroidota bacterium]
MLHEIKPGELSGEIKMPASKSFVQRFIAASVLADGMSLIHNPGRSEDVLASMAVAQTLGAYARTLSNGDMMIQPDSDFQGGELFCRESGLCARMYAPIVGLFDKDFSINGYRSLKRRHLLHELKQLEQFGLTIRAENEDIPIYFSGKLHAAVTSIDAGRSSQLLTGLLMALPTCDADSHIEARDLVSKPYVDMTTDILQRFGVTIHEDGSEYQIPGKQKYRPLECVAETDWSATANIMVAAAICGDLDILNVNFSSQQADIIILDVFEKAGINYSKISDTALRVKKSRPKAFSLDLTDAPDLFPAIIPLALKSGGPCRFTNINRLINKESNRLKAVIREYGKMGAKFDFVADNEVVLYPGQLSYSDVNSWGDHRIVMSLAIAGIANKGVKIHDSGHVAKSWPEFFTALKKAGGKISAYLR